MQRLIPSAPRGDSGVIAAHMAIVVAFALFAVVQLTRTTIAAQQINTRVTDIVGSVGSVDNQTRPVAVLGATDRITGQILQAAGPLAGQAGAISDAARGIDRHVTAILGNARAINASAQSINASVQGIGASVQGIGLTVDAIHANVAGITSSFQQLSPVVTAIQLGVVGINERAARVIALSSGIDSDAGNILRSVQGVELHAQSIDCSAAVHGQSC